MLATRGLGNVQFGSPPVFGLGAGLEVAPPPPPPPDLIRGGYSPREIRRPPHWEDQEPPDALDMRDLRDVTDILEILKLWLH